MTVMLDKDDAYMEILPIIGKIFHPSLLRPFSHFDVNKRHGCNFHRVMPPVDSPVIAGDPIDIAVCCVSRDGA